MTWLYGLNIEDYIKNPGGVSIDSGNDSENKNIRKESLGPALVQFCLRKHEELRDIEPKITKTEYGKPYLVHTNKIQFNISHSEDWIICGISHNPIGVDIEYLKPRSFKQIARTLFTSEERDFILNANDIESAFYKIWTLKESYLKCKGTGLKEPLGNSSIKIEPDTINIEIRDSNDSNFHFASYKLNKDYQVAVCVENEIPSTSITTISITDLEL